MDTGGGTKSLVENHRADGPNIAECREVREVEGLLVDKESPCENQRVPTSPHKMESSQKAESKQPTRRGKIKWPKVNKAEAWHKLDVDLIKVLKGSLREGGESKLKLLGTSYTKSAKTGLGKLPPCRGLLLYRKEEERRSSIS